jgi:hypothetical protein
MAVVPSSGTNIRLLSGIPFSNDYKHTRWFDTQSEQTTYFTNKPAVHSMSEATFQKIEGKNFVSVNKSIDELWNVNYLMFQNAQYNSKWFYAFVTKLEYKNKNVTYVHFQIDVFQTWKFMMNFKPSFVVREHCKLWNDDGSPVINTVDEGLAYGTEYDIVNVKNYIPFGNIQFLVIVAKQKMHDDVNTGEETNPSEETTKIKATVNGVPQPLAYYVHPFKSDGSDVDSNIGISNVKTVLKGLYTQDDAVNNIVSIFITDYVGAGVTLSGSTLTFDEDMYELAGVADDKAENFNTIYVKEIKEYEMIRKDFGNKYDDYVSVTESKLLMHPYTVLTLDDFKGNRRDFKNEYIFADFLEINVRGSMGTSNKVSYTVANYNVGQSVPIGELGDKVMLEGSIINNNPSDVPILNDFLAAYLQGNRNSISNQQNSIMFNGVANGLSTAVSGGVSASRRNPVGVAQAGIEGVQGAGNTVLDLQAIQAKQQDIANIPPSISKMGSNTAFEFGNGYRGLFLLKKQIKPEYRKKLTAFFNMYGYKLNEVKVPNFHTRQNWNFVQTVSCVITGSFNNEDLKELKAVFDNGITLWHTDDIGNYALSNEVI